MIEALKKLKERYVIGIVGGSDRVKQIEQLGSTVDLFDYAFAENGLVAYKDGQVFAKKSIADHLGEDTLQEFINFVLHYMSTIKLPVKRGTFIEFRTGLLNISPVGRNCSQKERDEFEIYDKEHNIRKDMITAIEKRFPDLDLVHSIGGQISFDTFPKVSGGSKEGLGQDVLFEVPGGVQDGPLLWRQVLEGRQRLRNLRAREDGGSRREDLQGYHPDNQRGAA
jgi:phosphomannomutase